MAKEMKTTRRHFIKTAFCATCGALMFPWECVWAKEHFSPADPHVKEAYFYKQLTGG
ncbi:MAG: hypothetical protein DRH15_08485, partial [Deltaproteobacteria bacterium]